MAESILKLRVESSEYDNKIKRAAEGLQRYADGCRKAGGTLTQLDEGVLEFTRSLGNMETVSKSARGSVNEMTKAFTELSVQYNKLTDEEKNAPFGQALKSSLDELRGRIQSGNEEIKNISESLNGGGGLKDALNQVAGKFGLNVDMLTKYGAALGAVSAALKVAKDAFFQSESNIDEWGRTVKGAEGAYDIFLQTLNNGNWSNFFSNLSQAITGARDLYDAFDRLNSIKANNAVAIAMVQAEIQQLRVLKQQGQNVDDKIKDATNRLAALQSQSAQAGINAGRGQVVNTLRNGVNSVGGAPVNDATLKYVADKIAKYGQDYIDGMKRQYTTLEKNGMVTKTETRTDSQGNAYEARVNVFDINALTKEQQKQYAIAKVVTERETEVQKGLTVWSQAVNEQTAATREQFRGNRYALQGAGGSGGGGGSSAVSNTVKKEEQAISESIQALKLEYRKASVERQDAIREEIKGLKEQLDVLKQIDAEAEGKVSKPIIGMRGIEQSPVGITQENPFEKYKNAVIDIVTPFDQFAERINYLKGIINDPPNIEAYQKAREELEKTEQAFENFKGGKAVKNQFITNENGKDTATITGVLGGINSGISQMVSGLEAMGMKIPEEIKDVINGVQGMISILSGIATIVSAIEAIQIAQAFKLWSGGGVVHAEGGYMVPGNHYGGDAVPSLLTSGEMVLNRFQQQALAASLQGNDGDGGYQPSRISGEQIWIAVNRYTKRTGRGELVTWK